MAKNNVIKLKTTPGSPKVVEAANGGRGEANLGDALSFYGGWPKPTAIVADGPYGLAKFPGEPHTADGLDQWYAPHVAEWAKGALPETTLWFWCSEVGWAEVHHVLKAHGWRYKAAHVWNKGIGHIAGNVNSDTIRGFPVVTEICVQYVREWRLPTADGEMLTLKEWLRHEWLRSGLPLYLTNEACGVKNAATRKYFTQCHLWYFPPADKMEMLAKYAEKHGQPTDRPYFSLDGKTRLAAEQWARMRAKWTHSHGVTNVWDEPALRADERLRAQGLKSLHINQKPLRLMERIINASTDLGDVIWEPFGGLCSATVAAMRTGRCGYASEVIPEFYGAACLRLDEEARKLDSQHTTAAARSRRA